MRASVFTREARAKMVRAVPDPDAPLTRALQTHAAQVMREGTVPELTKELCAALVAGLTFCTPLLVEHRANARRLGAATVLLNDLWDSAQSPEYTDAQKAAFAAAVALTREPRGLPDAVWAALARHFTDQEIVEVLCAIGLANYRARLWNALRF